MSAKIVGTVMYAVALGFLLVLSLRNRTTIWRALIGDNKKLDLPEVVVLMWLVIFPVISLADPLLGLAASEKVWWGLDLVLLFALTGRVGLELVRKK